MSLVNKYFDKIYCINLDSRTDRWEHASNEFKKYNIEVERFSAIIGTDFIKTIPVYHDALAKRPGLLGCNLSHLGVVKKSKELGLNNVLVFEDDIVFCENFELEFKKRIEQLPNDWDLFYLSGNNFYNKKSDYNGLIKVTENISKTTHTLTTHSYAIKGHMFDSIIEGIEKMDLPIDMYYRKLQGNCNAYISRPHLGWQLPGHSDIMGGFRNYENIKK